MDFISVTYLAALFVLALIYYMIPKNRQWILLLVFSIIFYSLFSVKMWIFFLFTCISTYIYTCFGSRKRNLLFFTVFLNLAVLLGLKFISSDIPFAAGKNLNRFAFLVPVGISFYTLQAVAYMADVYKNQAEPEKNFFKLLLFMTFFPQILQGPIPRFGDLKKELFREHDFNETTVLKGFYLLLWGYFQKMVIADRCNLYVNQVFDNYKAYEGMYLLLAGILYSIQLYADFAGCVAIARGSAQLLDINLTNNFNHPYFATSIRDFWRRWHISLSSFLRDYVYIPLGGNRKGRIRKYINILITFFLSGIWHGMGLHFWIWGLLHGAYQLVGELLTPVKAFFMKLLHMEKGSFTHLFLSRVFTFFLVMTAWIFFRAESVSKAVYIISHMFTKYNPWILVSGELYSFGIREEEWLLLILSVLLMIFIACLHEKNISIRDGFLRQPLFFRWICLMLFLFIILITGIYGPGYDSAQFIYGGF